MNIKNLIIEQLREEATYGSLPFLQNYIRVSGAGQCLRKRRFAMEQVEVVNEQTINSLLTVNFGNAFHEWLQGILSRRLGLHFIYEKRLVNPKLKVSGAFDGLIYDSENDEYILLDFKTTNPHKLKHLEKQNNADQNHIKQLAMYDYLLHQKETLIFEVENNEAKFYPIEHYPLLANYRNSKRLLKVIYIMRDAINIKEFTYDPTSKEVRKLVENELRDIHDIKKYPIEKQMKTKFDWECKYCPYVAKCEEIG